MFRWAFCLTSGRPFLERWTDAMRPYPSAVSAEWTMSVGRLVRREAITARASTEPVTGASLGSVVLLWPHQFRLRLADLLAEEPRVRNWASCGITEHLALCVWGVVRNEVLEILLKALDMN